MTRHKFFAISALILLLSAVLFAENISDSIYDYSLDIPEGFELADISEDQMSYHFTHPNYPVQFILKIYDTQDSKLPNLNSSDKVLGYALKKLSASMEIDTFAWNNSPACAISDFSMTLDKKYSGWAVCAPLKKHGAFIVLLAYTTSETRQSCNPFIMSILNSLCTDQNFYCFPGIIATYAFPCEGNRQVTLNIMNQKIVSTIDKSDVDAAQFVLEMEYNVLLLYSKHNLWKEAWQRYYRLIYRDSFGRLAQVSTDVIKTIYPLCANANSENPELMYAQTILSWVQTFSYKRDNASKETTDFTNLPAVLCGEGNDCDSRSMLVCVLLRSAGLESFMLISREYSHAMAAFENKAPGQKYEVQGTGREFLMGETTAKVTWGTIAQDHADRSKWIPVILP
ncbi:MAG: hypothetical protein IK102_08135 [Treponema sp.]|nr:hypothetical protein [Treponema sp.]